MRVRRNTKRKRCHCGRWFDVIGKSTECRPCEERSFCGLPTIERYTEYSEDYESEEEKTHDEFVGWDIGDIG